MITKVIGDSFITTNVTMNKGHEHDLIEEATEVILDNGIDAAFDILPPYRRQFANMALDRIVDGLDVLAAWEKGDMDYNGPIMQEAKKIYEEEEEERKRLEAEAEADTLAAAQREKDQLAAPPLDSPNQELDGYKRQAEHQLQPDTAKRMQSGGAPNAVGKKAVQKHGIPGT
jgi:hypothetical protein